MLRFSTYYAKACKKNIRLSYDETFKVVLADKIFLLNFPFSRHNFLRCKGAWNRNRGANSYTNGMTYERGNFSCGFSQLI